MNNTKNITSQTISHSREILEVISKYMKTGALVLGVTWMPIFSSMSSSLPLTDNTSMIDKLVVAPKGSSDIESIHNKIRSRCSMVEESNDESLREEGKRLLSVLQNNPNNNDKEFLNGLLEEFDKCIQKRIEYLVSNKYPFMIDDHLL